jgi:poly(3-hydroxybutyrate) depolymerase
MFTALLLAGWLAPAQAAELPKGQLTDPVACRGNNGQSYALYLPSTYSPDRAWPVLFLFDPGARGGAAVERYRPAAEHYGFIVAASNNSRNGQPSGPAVDAMSSDVFERFHVDMKRIYVGGMSGGARVAMAVALGSSKVAGVIASSASYPDGQRRESLPFPVFATAGTEDFNHLEMRLFDRDLKTPHRLVVFEGGHVWPTSELATQAIEWLELQAMRDGRKPRDQQEIDRIFAKRISGIPAGAATKDTKGAKDQKEGSLKDGYLALESLVVDFDGLKDVSTYAKRADVLAHDRAVKAALAKDDDEDEREEKMNGAVSDAEDQLANARSEAARQAALGELRERWKALSEQANAPTDSMERRLARRVLTGLSAGGASTTDADYLAIIREYRMGRGR